MDARHSILRSDAALQRRPALARLWPAIVSIVGACLLATLMRLPGLWLPLERDEGAYGYVASRWLQGALPYRDVFDHKPPLIYLLSMPPLLVGTPGAFDVRVWASLIFLAGLPVVFAIGRTVWDRPHAALATILYA